MKILKKESLIFVVLFAYSLVQAQVDNVEMFIFGHSLIDHRPPAIATPSDETTVPHWMERFASASGKNLAVGGQFGFMPQHAANLPPVSQLGYDIVDGVWDADYEMFSETSINTILLTAANFIQYQPANEPHPIDYSTTVVEATETLLDWVDSQRENTNYYIYANWPEMDLQNAFPPNLPTDIEVSDFHDQTKGLFLDWWTDYQDLMLVSRPEFNVRLIPVGPIISGIMTDIIPGQVPFDAWYEDSAPHGRPSLYFLAGMITYMAIYEEKINIDLNAGDQIHPGVRNNQTAIVNYIWEELGKFNFDNGESRVFVNELVSTASSHKVNSKVSLFPNPTEDIIYIDSQKEFVSFKIYDSRGVLIKSGAIETDQSIDIALLNSGFYIVSLHSSEGANTTNKFQLLK